MDNVNTYKVNKEAVKKIAEKVYDNGSTVINRNDLEELFPELQESGDERMIKFIKQQLFNIKKTITENYELDAKLTKAIDWLEKQGEQKPAVIIPKFRIGDEIKTANEESLTITKIDEKGYWSEDLFICNFDDTDKWEFVEQKSAWSEEEEKKQNYLIALLQNSTMNNPAFRSVNEGLEEWLKSLKDRYTWKPSDEQMRALNYVVNLMASSERPTENDLYYNILKSLRQQLNKLK